MTDIPMSVSTEVIPMSDHLCIFLRHKVTIEDKEYFVYHYQENKPTDEKMKTLQEDALIKTQLTIGDKAACET